jgi:hypothetical protein
MPHLVDDRELAVAELPQQLEILELLGFDRDVLGKWK